MTLAVKLPKVRRLLLKHIAFCETKVTAGPWNPVHYNSFDTPSCEIREQAVGACVASGVFWNNATFIALSRTLDPLMARGLVVALDGFVKLANPSGFESTQLCDNDGQGCQACAEAVVFLQSLLDLFPDEMLTRI